MKMIIADSSNTEQILPIFTELEQYYFGADTAKAADIRNYFNQQVFSQHSGVIVLLAVIEEQVIGFATFTIMYPAPRLSGQAYMKDLFTSEKARGCGVGKAMMQFIAAYVVHRGCSRLDWTCESSNSSAANFYRAIGAKQIHEKQYFRFQDSELEQFSGKA